MDQDNDTLERLRRVCETNLARYYAEAVGTLRLVAEIRSRPASVTQILAVEGQHQKAESALDGYLTAERLLLDYVNGVPSGYARQIRRAR